MNLRDIGIHRLALHFPFISIDEKNIGLQETDDLFVVQFIRNEFSIWVEETRDAFSNCREIRISVGNAKKGLES